MENNIDCEFILKYVYNYEYNISHSDSNCPDYVTSLPNFLVINQNSGELLILDSIIVKMKEEGKKILLFNNTFYLILKSYPSPYSSDDVIYKHCICKVLTADEVRSYILDELLINLL
jgi:hypothetical protein